MDDERITTARQRTSWFRSPWFSIAKCLLCVAMVLLCIWGFQQEAKAASSVITVTLDKNGGTGGTSTIYYKNGKYYSNSSCTSVLTYVSVPSKKGYIFNGYTGTLWDEQGGDYREGWPVLSSGAVSGEPDDRSSSTTWTAQWKACTSHTYTLTIDPNGGSRHNNYPLGLVTKGVQTVEKPLFCVKQNRGSMHI